MFKKICFSTMFILATNALSDINVTTTIYPLYSIAKEVGGDKIKLNNIKLISFFSLSKSK